MKIVYVCTLSSVLIQCILIEGAFPRLEMVDGNCSNVLRSDLVYEKHVRLPARALVRRVRNVSILTTYKTCHFASAKHEKYSIFSVEQLAQRKMFPILLFFNLNTYICLCFYSMTYCESF